MGLDREKWRKRFQKEEVRMLDLFAKRPGLAQDGSFFMGTFLRGYYTGLRHAKENAKKSKTPRTPR